MNATVVVGKTCGTVGKWQDMWREETCDVVSLQCGEDRQGVDDVLCELYLFYNTSSTVKIIIVDGVNTFRLGSFRKNIVTSHLLSDVNDLLQYLVQQEALEPVDCFHNDVVDLPNAGACSYRYGKMFKKVIPGLMVQYVHPSRLKS